MEVEVGTTAGVEVGTCVGTGVTVDCETIVGIGVLDATSVG
jgi:hypothetical protein